MMLSPGVRLGSYEIVAPQAPIRATAATFSPWDVAPDGKRFAVFPEDPKVAETGSVHATFLLNFFDYLRTAAAGKR